MDVYSIVTDRIIQQLEQGYGVMFCRAAKSWWLCRVDRGILPPNPLPMAEGKLLQGL